MEPEARAPTSAHGANSAADSEAHAGANKEVIPHTQALNGMLFVRKVPQSV